MMGGNMNKMMKQVQKMQQDMMKLQEDLQVTEFTASSGGGMDTVSANGAKQILSVKIKPEAVDPDDVEMLEDLVLAAVNSVMEEIDKSTQEKMGAFSGGMPGMF